MVKKYLVSLTDAEREELIRMTKKGKPGARKINRAHILLMADEGRIDREIAEILRIGVSTVQRTRRRFAEGGLAMALNEKPRIGAPRILSESGEALLVAEARGKPPEGHDKWTMRMLADRVVELGLAESVSDETIRLILKRNWVVF